MAFQPKPYAPYAAEFSTGNKYALSYKGTYFADGVKPEADVRIIVDLLNGAYTNGANDVAAQLEPAVEAAAEQLARLTPAQSHGTH